MTELSAADLSLSAGDKALVSDVSLRISKDELVALLGPNGAGKTSLLRAMTGQIKPARGHVTLNGSDVSTLSPMTRAQSIAYLPQTRPLAWPNIVRDIVALGRYSHGASPGRLRGADAEAVDEAIAECDLQDLSERKADSLSGGELARVHLARAFAARAPLLIADEPVAALDPRHQFRIMDLIRRYVDTGGNGALVVLHDIALAAKYADRLIWMKEGRIIADGPPLETLTADRLRDIYGVKAKVEGLNVRIDGAL